jgi:hypothetical protein
MSVGSAGIVLGTYLTGGIGSMTAVPAGAALGTPLGVFPPGAKAVRLYLKAGSSDSVTFTIANTVPTVNPTVTMLASASVTGPNWDEPLSNGQMVYVTATTGSPSFRWM